MKIFFTALSLMLFLAAPVYAAGKYQDYMFRGMPGYTIEKQSKNFNRLEIKSMQPGNKDVTKTVYEGNRALTLYWYTDNHTENMPSDLQILRNYQSVTAKLGGKILYETGKEFHGSFIRNDKQYYIAVTVTGFNNYEVVIIEPAEMQVDVEILDADTIVYKLEKEGYVTLYINFDTDKSIIKPESYSLIDEIAAALKSKPSIRVKLEGHTDNVGVAAYNKKLSDDRANAAMSAIIAKGIDQSRLSAEGFGLEKPIADNNTEAGRAKNRRVEMVRQEAK